MSTRGFGERCDLSSLEVLQHRVWTEGSCNVGNFLHRLLFPAREPNSYQCSARVPSGPGSLSRGILRSLVWMSSATSDILEKVWRKSLHGRSRF